MKCICGYEYLDEFDLKYRLKKEPNFKNGDEDFIYTSNSINFTHPLCSPFSCGYDHSVYVCPSCGTLKIDV